MKTRTFIKSIIAFIIFSSCADVIENRTQIEENYFVEKDPSGNFKTLYYDIGDENSIERIRNVKRVGHSKTFIVAETENGYYFIEKNKDKKYLNGDEIIGEPKTQKYFENWITKNVDFKFDYYVEK